MKNVKTIALNQLINYIATDPLNKLPKIMELAKKLDRKGNYLQLFSVISAALSDENSHWHKLVENLFHNVDSKVIRKLAECFAINTTLVGKPIREKYKAKYSIQVPWAILMDPTSACNLSCTGCWAAQYEKEQNLPYAVLDSICQQGKKMGIYWYLFSGGEPLIRKKDIIKLCEEHQDCFFLAFTNGTLVDEKFCEEVLRTGNLTLCFSIEGIEQATDMRRGKGSYQKVIEAMELMKKYRLFFGYSTCYHRYNTESVASDEFVDEMLARGCFYAWNFTYIPIGKMLKRI